MKLDVLFPVYSIAIYCSVAFLFPPVFSYTINTIAYEIRDLEKNDSSFSAEVVAWDYSSITSGLADVFTSCGGTYLLGGYGILLPNKTHGSYLKRTFNDLTPHQIIYYSFELWLIKSWDSNDSLELALDEVLINMFNRVSNLNGVFRGCGSVMKTVKIKVFGALYHSQPSFTFKVIGKCDSSPLDEAFGIRNLSILLAKSGFLSSSTTLCGVSDLPLPKDNCLCPEGKYKDSLGQCSQCHWNCVSCFGPTEKDCYRCKEGLFFNGIECSFCESSCPLCKVSGKYGALVDNTCKVCQSLTVEYQNSIGKQHLYKLQIFPEDCGYNQTIVQTYLSGTPISNTSIPSLSFEVTQTGLNIYQLNIILGDSLIQPVDMNLTLLSLYGVLTIPKTFIESSILSTVRHVLASIMAASLGGTLALGATGALWSILGFQKFVGYLRYINVDYPYHVEIFLSLANFSIWDLLPNPLSYLTVSVSKDFFDQENELAEIYRPPRKFDQNQVTPFFIKSVGTIFLINFFLLFILSVVSLMRRIPVLKHSKILKYIKTQLRWNMIARTFLENGVPLALASFLQLRIISFERLYLTICVILAIISLVFIILMTIFLVKALQERDNPYLSKRVICKIYGTLYEGIVLQKTSGKYYHLVVFFRGLLVVTVTAFLQKFPSLQIMLLIKYNCFLIYFLFNKAFFKGRWLDVINRVKEILLLICEMCILCLMAKVNSISYSDILGWMIVGTIATCFGIEFVYLIGIQIVGIKKIGKTIFGIVMTIKIYFKDLINVSKSK